MLTPLVGATLATLFVLVPSATSAQAWLPAKGEANLSVTYQVINLDGHFDVDGSKLPNAIPSRAHVAIVEVEYGLTDRFTMNVRLPFVASKFTGSPDDPYLAELRELLEEFRRMKEIPEALTSLDTGGYYPTFQDFGLLFRYNLIDGRVAVTPLFGVTIPSHDYRTVGEAAPGQDLNALHVGANVGWLLDPMVPRAYIHAKYAYSFVERAYDEFLNRSAAEFEVGYAVTPLVSVRALAAWAQSHGNLHWPEAYNRGFGLDGRPANPELLLDHDRLLASRYWHLGGGTTVSLTDSIDLDAAVVGYVSGADTHYGLGASFGITWRLANAAPPTPPSSTIRSARR